MKLSLIANPFSYKLHEENLKVVQRYFGLFPPLSLAWVAAIAEQSGHEVEILDARTLCLTPEQVVSHLKRSKPDLVGFMMTTYMFQETLEWIRFVKTRLPNVKIIVGGYNVGIYPDESILPSEIDYACIGSAYETIPGLLNELDQSRLPNDVPGLFFKKSGKIIKNPKSKIHDFNKYPNPARHLLPNELYAEFPGVKRNFTVMVTSKGCPMICSFCEAGQTPYDPRSPQIVVDEMEECYTKHGIREVDIFDYDFLIDRKRVMAICDEIKKRKLKILWACRARVDTVDEELLTTLQSAGCGRIYFGIESGNQWILDNVKKGITLKQIRNAVKMTQKAGIKTLGFFMVGLPGETRETFRQTLQFAKSLKLDYYQFSKATAKPLTGLWHDMVRETHYDYWKEYILGNAEEVALPRPWTELSNDEIDYLTREAYKKMHSSPFFLIKHVLQIRSFDEFRRKFLGWLEMMFQQEPKSVKDIHFSAYIENKKRLEAYKNKYCIQY